VLSVDELVALALFAEVVERRSFTAGAAAAGMAKSVVSRRIAALERRLGMQLLHRSTRRLAPTPAGLRLYERCTELVAAARRARGALADSSSRPQGTLRVSGTSAFARMHLTPAVADFVERHPEVDVQLFPTDRAVDQLAEGFDVAVRIGRPADSWLVARTLVIDRVVLVASPRYLERRGVPRRVPDLAGHLRLRFSTAAEHTVWGNPPEHGPFGVPGRVALMTNDATVLRDAALLGMGLAVLPSFVVAADVREGALVRVLESVRLPEVQISAVHPQRPHLPACARLFIDALAERFRSPSWRRASLLTR